MTIYCYIIIVIKHWKMGTDNSKLPLAPIRQCFLNILLAHLQARYRLRRTKTHKVSLLILIQYITFVQNIIVVAEPLDCYIPVGDFFIIPLLSSGEFILCCITLSFNHVCCLLVSNSYPLSPMLFLPVGNIDSSKT